MQNFFSAEVLRAVAELVIVLDQHYFGALVFLAITLVFLAIIWVIFERRPLTATQPPNTQP